MKKDPRISWPLPCTSNRQLLLCWASSNARSAIPSMRRMSTTMKTEMISHSQYNLVISLREDILQTPPQCHFFKETKFSRKPRLLQVLAMITRWILKAWTNLPTNHQSTFCTLPRRKKPITAKLRKIAFTNPLLLKKSLVSAAWKA